MANGLATKELVSAFTRGRSWKDYLSVMKENRELIAENYAAQALDPSEKAGLKKPQKPYHVLALVQDWCGDTVANLPIVARLEEAGMLKLSILEKDPDNTELGLPYPHADGSVHIPIYIVFDADGNELGNFVERSDGISQKLRGWVKEFWTARPKDPEFGKNSSDLSEAKQNELHAYLRERRSTVRAQERAEMIEFFNGVGGA